MSLNILVQHGTRIYSPVLTDKVTWKTERKGAPGRLEFSAVSDSRIDLATEGDAVQFTERADSGKISNIFKGYIFKIQKDKNGITKFTCFDQLRYLKNKDTYVYTGKRADEVVRMICDDFGLKRTTLENTVYKIPSRIENNTSLFDIVGNALDLTLENRKVMYVLYDDFGLLRLISINGLMTNVLIDASGAEDFSYVSTIDKETYNKIKLVYDNSDTGQREIYTAASTTTALSWGILQYYDTLQKNENGREKAKKLLELYNTKSKSLSIKNAFGDNSVRAGSMVFVRLDLGDTKVDSLMLVEKCSHEWAENQHFMTLELRGGDINNS